MVMTPEQIRLKQNPVLTNLLLGMGQGTMIAERLFPRLPQTLSSIVLARLGNERLQRYNLRRAPGARTKRIDISYDGQVYTVNQYSVDVPIPRELIRESEEGARMNLTANLDVSRIQPATVSASSMPTLGISGALATTAGMHRELWWISPGSSRSSLWAPVNRT